MATYKHFNIIRTVYNVAVSMFFSQLQACRMRQGKTALQSVDHGIEVEVEAKKIKLQPSKFFAPPESPESMMDVKGTKPPLFVVGGRYYTDMTGRRIPIEDTIQVAPPPCYHNCMVVMASPSGEML